MVGPVWSPASPYSELTTCTTAAFCVALLPAATGRDWDDARFLCVEIHPLSMLTLNFHLHSFIFICQSPFPLSFETPFLLLLSLFPIFFPFSSPPVSSLYPFHLATPMAHPHSISSLTPSNLVHAFPLLQPSVPRKHNKNVILFCFHNLFLHFLQILHTFNTTDKNSGIPLHKKSNYSQHLWTNFRHYQAILLLLCF